MAVRIKFDQAKMNKLIEAQIGALEKTAEAVKSDVVASQVVPKDVGTLERSAYVDTSQSKEGKAAVGFNTPYARRLYYHPEYNFRKDKNPNAQGRWMDMYLPGGEKENFAQDAFTRFLKQLAGGIIK
jgi:hypothetical protein